MRALGLDPRAPRGARGVHQNSHRRRGVGARGAMRRAEASAERRSRRRRRRRGGARRSAPSGAGARLAAHAPARAVARQGRGAALRAEQRAAPPARGAAEAAPTLRAKKRSADCLDVAVHCCQLAWPTRLTPTRGARRCARAAAATLGQAVHATDLARRAPSGSAARVRTAATRLRLPNACFVGCGVARGLPRCVFHAFAVKAALAFVARTAAELSGSSRLSSEDAARARGHAMPVPWAAPWTWRGDGDVRARCGDCAGRARTRSHVTEKRLSFCFAAERPDMRRSRARGP